MLLESRAIYDAAAMIPMFRLRKFLPQGDDHPVLVLPGFLASSRSTKPLRNFIADLGYKAHRWKLGYNMGYSFKLHYGMRERISELAERYGAKVSLVGWSLGGVYARELAREMPDIVRQVISMGSPIVGGPKYTSMGAMYQRSGIDMDAIEATIAARERTPIRVPVTSIYSRRDGIVGWQASIDRHSPEVDHIEVKATHLGLGISTDVVKILASKLASA